MFDFLLDKLIENRYSKDRFYVSHLMGVNNRGGEL